MLAFFCHDLGPGPYDSLQTGKSWEGHYRNAGFTHGMTTGRAAGVPGCWDKTLPDGVTVAHGNGDAGLTIGRKTMEPIRRFLDDHATPGSRPFFLWYAPVLPHEPHNAAEEYLNLYHKQADLPAHFVHYYAACTWFDDTVGQLLEMLDERRQSKNTLFVFVVDNGWTPSAKAHPQYPGYAVDKRSKRSPLDRGLRTPILIRWDGHVRSATHTTLCSGVDVVPTILSALGVADEADGMSGIDLMPSALGHESLDADRAVFGEIYPGDASTLGNPAGDVAYRWVRDRNLKLIVPHIDDTGKAWNRYVDRMTLFDVENAPGETMNLSGEPDYRDDIERLTEILDEWWRARDD